jgi:hypothetical protein
VPTQLTFMQSLQHSIQQSSGIFLSK